MTETARDFDWRCWPETEALVAELVAEALRRNDFAASLAERMATDTSTRLVDWIDHLTIARPAAADERFSAVGYVRQEGTSRSDPPVLVHHGGLFPRLRLVDSAEHRVAGLAIKVERAADFSRAHDLGIEPTGSPMGPYRTVRVEGRGTEFLAVERHGYSGFEPFPGELARRGRMAPQAARDALAALELWQTRRRRFDDDEQGFDFTDRLLDRVMDRCGGCTDLACDLIFEAERAYWQSRNRAGQVQKARQDRLGLGWANHDHHTFRCSRRFFPRVITLLGRLGFRLRERFHAGSQAGWGAQILEHPTTGIVVFADLDLAPDEAEVDFSRQALPELPRPNTVGLWVGLHGESFLQAGMHHLEAQFDFDRLRVDLEAESGIATMAPFSDFPFLRQAFTAGQRWPVDPLRAGRLLERGAIDVDQHARFLQEGAIGSHLENLQRTQGYQGFNQRSVGVILAATDPRLRH